MGPKQTAQALPLLWRKLPQIRSKPAKTLGWNALARPRELLDSISEAGEFPLNGIEQIAHDLWDRGSLPPMTPSQQVALLAVGFNLWPSADKSDPDALKLIPFESPRQGLLEFRRTPGDIGGSGRLKLYLKQKFPTVKAQICLLYTSPSPRDKRQSRMPSSA